jgi:hypothetical protein
MIPTKPTSSFSETNSKGPAAAAVEAPSSQSNHHSLDLPPSLQIEFTSLHFTYTFNSSWKRVQ